MKGPAKAAAIGLATGVLLAAAGLRADERDAVVKVLAQRGRRTAVGTGVIVTADGYVLTAEHVASRGEPGVVYRDRELPAAIVYDPPKNNRDEALLLKIQDAGPFAYVPVAAVPPKVGDRVRSYGFPIGAELSINEGVVTKVDEHWIWASHYVLEGNSGGPLLNERGELVGIASARAALPGTWFFNPNDEERSRWIGLNSIRVAMAYARGRVSAAAARTLVVFTQRHCGPCVRLKDDVEGGRWPVRDLDVLFVVWTGRGWSAPAVAEEFRKATGRAARDTPTPILWLRGTAVFRSGYAGPSDVKAWLAAVRTGEGRDGPGDEDHNGAADDDAPPPPPLAPQELDLLAELKRLKDDLAKTQEDFQRFQEGGMLAKLKEVFVLKEDKERLAERVDRIKDELAQTRQRARQVAADLDQLKAEAVQTKADLDAFRNGGAIEKMKALSALKRDAAALRGRVEALQAEVRPLRRALTGGPVELVGALIGLLTGLLHRRFAL